MIKVNGQEVKTWTFPGGEVGVTVEVEEDINVVRFEAKISSSDEVMQLLMAKEAVDSQLVRGTYEISLSLRYLPYAQQDRYCEDGESLSIKVFAGLINNANFDKVEVWDCHSDVGAALIDRCNPVPVWNLFKYHHAFNNLRHHIQQGTVLVSPDAGANKKVQKVAQTLQAPYPVMKADKKRCTKTGEITGTEVYGTEDQIRGRDFLIVDDICVGGGTFIPLAQKLKELGARGVSLYVTHGVFSRGIQTLIDGGIDWVYTTNSREHQDEIKHHKNLTILGD